MLQPPARKKTTFTQFFISLLMMAAIMVGFFRYPAQAQKIVMYMLYGGFGLGILIALIVFGSLAWRKYFPTSFAKSGITIQDQKPLGLVGSEGKGSSLRIKETAEGTLVAWAPMDYAFILVGTFIFGPFMAGSVATHYEKATAKMPAIFFIIMFLICGIACYSFFSTLWTLIRHRPSLLIKASGIEFWRGHQLVETFWSHQTEKVFIEDHTYVYSTNGGGIHDWPNYILTIGLEGGKLQRLCISDKRAQIENLKSLIEKKFQMSVV